MVPCHVVQIETPKGVLLHGLWFGKRKSKTVFIIIHGLTGSLFSLSALVRVLSRHSAVMTFNNRGYEQITTLKRRVGKRIIYKDGGTAFESFTDAPDDIEGAIRAAKRNGATRIFLVGHSTGCQKAVLWAARGGRGVKGLVLLGPLSDYADTLSAVKRKRFASGVAHARAMLRKGEGNELMPKRFTGWLFLSARRFLSLYTPESSEEVFPYAQKGRKARALSLVKKPLLAVFAGEDEFADRPAVVLKEWFEAQSARLRGIIVPRVGHSFKGGERKVVREILRFVESA